MKVDIFIQNITTIIAIIGGLFVFFQWINSNKLKRVEFINQIIEKIRFDKDLQETMYMIDYSKNWYDENFHNGNNGTEAKIDKLLSYLSYICYLKENAVLSKKEFSILEYEINRVCSSFSVQSYLWNLYHFTNKIVVKCSFSYLINYGLKNKIISRDFLEKENNNKYVKYLNF